jgi:beta-galactosidase
MHKDQPLAQTPDSDRQRTLLDANWQFHEGPSPATTQETIAPDYNDTNWQRIDVPHDYVLSGTYADSPDKTVRGHAYLKYDLAWYRKHFTIPASDQGKILRLDFDGVFRNSQVWLNGQLLGHHESGYTPFSFDITKIAKVGSENVLTVLVDPRQFEGWWYEGGGIYRHVYLTALNPLHVAQYGTYVTSIVPNGDQGAHDKADITIQTTLNNDGVAASPCTLKSEILDPNGHAIQTINTDASIDASGNQTITQNAELTQPKLWSIESPNCYQLRTTILKNGQPIDATVTTFGIRTLRYDKDKGFFLNGKHVEIQGVACHQDFAGVGIAVPDSLQPWRVQQLQKFGANAWRTAHNPPNEAVLDACDRLGMMVMDENRHLGDDYRHHSPKGTKADNLSDLATMIQRDRNHPSIILWSMCNEEGLQGSPEGAAIFTKMMAVVHKYDKTRPITSAMNGGIDAKKGDADVEDIIGVNYHESQKQFDEFHQRHPDKPMFGSEDTNDKTARGEYVEDKVKAISSAYNLSDTRWLALFDRPYMCGSFTWTGFDYKGEPNPYGWPDVSNNTGLLDGCGFPKDKAFYFQSAWSTKPMVHIFPIDWNNPPKDDKGNVRVIAFSNAQKVELFLNGKSLGTKDMPHAAHLEWQVPFVPGDLTAKAYNDNKTVATDTVQTTDKPARIELKIDRTKLHTDGQDTVVAAISVLDDKGRVVPDSDNRITFNLEGPGKILGVGNGNPADHDSDKADNRKAFHGHCIAVIQATTTPGTIKLTATSPGLTPATQTLTSK